MVQARKQTRIPSAWTKDELHKLIGAIDRGNPKGKHDYAIILLACVLGLRVTDIKSLTFDSFHWEEKKLVFVQSKTRGQHNLAHLWQFAINLHSQYHTFYMIMFYRPFIIFLP